MPYIDPFTNIPYTELQASTDKKAGAVFLSDLRELQIGQGGANVFRADRDGIFMGAKTFAAAPFSVDMSGSVVATKIQIVAAAGSQIDWSYIQNIAIENADIVDATIQSAKIASLDANKINVGTLTGFLIQTAVSGQRVVIDSSNDYIKFYDSNGNLSGTIAGAPTYGIYADGDFYINGNLQGVGNLFAYRYYANAGSGSGIEPIYDNSITSGTSSRRWSNVYSQAGDFAGNVTVGGNVYGSFYTPNGCTSGHHQPYYDNTYDLGNTTYMWRNLFIRGYLWTSGTIMGSLNPYSAGTYNLGSASLYWNEVNYKTLTDRGCLGVFDNGVLLQDGKKVSDIEALMSIKPHPTLKTVYGVPRFDYATMPKAVYKPAPIAKEDIYDKMDKNKLLWKKGEKMGEDGAETTALISIMIGAIKELHTEVKTLKQIIWSIQNKNN